jgi:hypothetical protein
VAEASEWEKRFVRRYIHKPRQERYLAFIDDEKRRPKILNRLSHTLDYDDRKATDLDKQQQTSDGLLSLLRAQNVSPTCYFMADSNDLDGSEFDLETGVDELLFSEFGAVLICPPKPIALYKPEDVRILILLK